MSPLNILCFGNSITAGYTNSGALYHPYAESLLASLEKSLPTADVTTDVQGLPGDQVISPPGGFFPRMDILYEESQISYNWAVILGGTNDLGTNREGEDIFEGLERVWAIPLKNGTKVLALTVPECGYCNPNIDGRRDTLNDLILEHEAENYYTLDLHSAIPYWRMPVDKRKDIWDDGIHFTPAGYDLMGSIIADRLVELISVVDGIEKAPQNPFRNELKVRDASSKSATYKTMSEGRRLRSGRIV